MSFLKTVAKLVLLAPPLVCGGPVDDNLIVHEWGTFTSAAARDGTSVQWAPLSAAPDLPCFVDRLSPRNLKLSPGLVRMETPVLYFYSPSPLTASIHVDFPQGWITEWYPHATNVKPELSGSPMIFASLGQGQIDWDSVQVSPGQNPRFLSTQGHSRYFAARNTDSAPLQIGAEQEKFIFYRGLGDFAVPLQPEFLSDRQLEIRNTGSETIPLAIVFENRNGEVGFRIVRNIKDTMRVNTPELTGDLQDLQRQIAAALMELGLYKKEALAMIDTWQDSWFETGMRIFYIVPRPMVDSVLPLKISPEPATTTRVFVGRIELLSPWVEQTLEMALATGDIETLARFGRFLNPFLMQLETDHRIAQSPSTTEYLARAYTKMAREFSSAPCVQ